jgi:hypothetical protein
MTAGDLLWSHILLWLRDTTVWACVGKYMLFNIYLLVLYNREYMRNKHELTAIC